MNLCIGATKEFEPLVQIQMNQARQFGWNVHLYDLGGLGMGRPLPGAVLEGNEFKPRMIADCLYHGDMIYLDADAIPFKDIGDVFDLPFDVCVTLRASHELDGKSDQSRRFLGWSNAGVMFLRATDVAFDFLEAWSDRTRSVGCDQEALNELLYPELKRPAFGQLFKSAGANVGMVPGPVYNFTMGSNAWPEAAVVVHFTGGKWSRWMPEIRSAVGIETVEAAR